MQEPKLLPYFRGGELPGLTAVEEARLRLIAAMYCDMLNIGLHEQQTISSTASLREWRAFCSTLLGTSEVLRTEVTAKPHAYPLLAAIVRADAGRDITTSNPPLPEQAPAQPAVEARRPGSEPDGIT